MHYYKSPKLFTCGNHLPKIIRWAKANFEFPEEAISSKLSYMKDGTDEISKKTLDFVYSCLMNGFHGSQCCPKNFEWSLKTIANFNEEKAGGLYNKYILDL